MSRAGRWTASRRTSFNRIVNTIGIRPRTKRKAQGAKSKAQSAKNCALENVRWDFAWVSPVLFALCSLRFALDAAI
jgi:hypothetical protein